MQSGKGACGAILIVLTLGVPCAAQVGAARVTGPRPAGAPGAGDTKPLVIIDGDPSERCPTRSNCLRVVVRPIPGSRIVQPPFRYEGRRVRIRPGEFAWLTLCETGGEWDPTIAPPVECVRMWEADSHVIQQGWHEWRPFPPSLDAICEQLKGSDGKEIPYVLLWRTTKQFAGTHASVGWSNRLEFYACS